MYLEVRIPVVVDPEKAALQQVVVHAGALFRREVVVGRILHAQVRTPEEIGIHGGNVRKAGVAIVPPADRRCGQLGETHHEVVVRLRIVVAPAGLPRSADVLVPQATEREAELLVGKSVVDRYLEVASVSQDGDLLRRAAHDGQTQRQPKGQCEPHPSSRCPRPPHVRILQRLRGKESDGAPEGYARPSGLTLESSTSSVQCVPSSSIVVLAFGWCASRPDGRGDPHPLALPARAHRLR